MILVQLKYAATFRTSLTPLEANKIAERAAEGIRSALVSAGVRDIDAWVCDLEWKDQGAVA